MNLKPNISLEVSNDFFEFAEPFLQKSGFQMVAPSPRMYRSETNVPTSSVFEIVKKLKTLRTFTNVVHNVQHGIMKNI